MSDDPIIEIGSDTGIRFMTSKGMLHIKAGESIILTEEELNAPYPVMKFYAPEK